MLQNNNQVRYFNLIKSTLGRSDVVFAFSPYVSFKLLKACGTMMFPSCRKKQNCIFWK